MHVVLLAAPHSRATPRPESTGSTCGARSPSPHASRSWWSSRRPGRLRRLRGPGGRWARYAATPRRAEIDGVRLLFPRYLQVPGMGPWAGVAMALGAAGIGRHGCAAQGRCDVLFAQAVLPDGLAAVLLGRWLGVPVACLGRGTDVHGLPAASATTRWLARWTLVRHAAAVGVVADGPGAHARADGGRRAPVPCCPRTESTSSTSRPAARATARRALRIDEDARLGPLRRAPRRSGRGSTPCSRRFARCVRPCRTRCWRWSGRGRSRLRSSAASWRTDMADAVRLAGEVAAPANPRLDAGGRRRRAAERGRRHAERRARGARVRAPGRGDAGRRRATCSDRRRWPARASARSGRARARDRRRPRAALGRRRDPRPRERHDLGAQRRGDGALPGRRPGGRASGRRSTECGAEAPAA